MKICFVAPRLHTNQLTLVDSLTNNGHSVVFLSLGPGPEYLETDPNCEVDVLPREKISPLLVFFLKLRQKIQGMPVRQNLLVQTNYKTLTKRLADHNPDIVIIRDVKIPLSLQAFRATRKLDLPTSLYTQHPLEDKESKITWLLQALRIVPKHRITPIRKQKTNTYNKKTNTYYVPLTTTTNFDISHKQHFANNRLNLIFVGKYTLQRKNHLLAVQAVHKLSTKKPVHLTMIGGHAADNTRIYDEICNYIARHKLEKTVTLKHSIPHKTMSKEYANADAFIFPSVDEPLSISTLEAMAHGTIPIVTSSNGSQYFIENGINGFVLKENTADAIVKTLEKFYDRETLKCISEATYKTFQDEYSVSLQYGYFIKAISDKII